MTAPTFQSELTKELLLLLIRATDQAISHDRETEIAEAQAAINSLLEKYAPTRVEANYISRKDLNVFAEGANTALEQYKERLGL